MSKILTPDPEGFDDLWQLWREHARKSDGRGKARPTYIRWMLAGADPADILDGARWHLRSMKPEERPYIQLLSVYLNGERWADDCEKERAYQQRLQEHQQKQTQPTNVVQIAPRPTKHELSPEERQQRERRAAEILARAGFAASDEFKNSESA